MRKLFCINIKKITNSGVKCKLQCWEDAFISILYYDIFIHLGEK